MKETGIVQKKYSLNRKNGIALMLAFVMVVGAIVGVWRANASASTITYAKYNGVDYASIILNNENIDNDRYYALLKAQQMATVQWTAPVTFSSWVDNKGVYSTTRATDGTVSQGSFLAGKTYVGIPYSMANHSADDVKWMNKITSGVTASSLNTYYYAPYTSTTTAYGADCSYFVYQALKAANTGYSFSYRTTAGIAGSGYFTKIAKCADYSNSNIDALFAQLKPGDIALKSGHVMLYVGRTGNKFAFFEAAFPVTRYVTYDLSTMQKNGYTFYKFNGFNDNASANGNQTTSTTPSNPYNYVSGAYQVYTKTGETLNIRSGQGVEFDILAEIPDLTKVIVSEINSYWGKVTYNGVTGWISLLYCNYIGSAACDTLSCIDYPIHGSEVTGSNLYLQGWTLDKHEIAKITYTINNSEEVDATLASRADVAAAYPAYPTVNNSWTARVDLSQLENGENTVTIYAYCSTGKKVAIGSRTVLYNGEEIVEESTTEEPTTEAPTTEAPTTEASTTEETTIEETTIEETTTEIPNKAPTIEESVEESTNSNILTALLCKTKYHIDYPINNTKVTGTSIYLQGWTIDTHGIEKVTYTVNDGNEVELKLGYRADVAAAYPKYSIVNNSWSGSIETSGLSDGNNKITIYAYCGDNKRITVGTRNVMIEKSSDTIAPIISDVKVTEKSEKGYTITCTVTDESKISYVQFPTWTAENGQDDIVWGNGVITDNTVVYRVETSAHNGETANYITHIYAYDEHGNKSLVGVNVSNCLE